MTLVWLPDMDMQPWTPFLPLLTESGRVVSFPVTSDHASRVTLHDARGWVAAENRDRVERSFADGDATYAVRMLWHASASGDAAHAWLRALIKRLFARVGDAPARGDGR